MAERPEDLNLPNSVVTRIIKDALPDGVNVSKDARLAISKAASIFVLYATSCANNFAMQGKRKTISGNDVLNAMSEMEFERFVEPLKKSLEAYRNQQKGKKDAAEQRKKSKETTAEETPQETPTDEAPEQTEVVEVSDSEEEAAAAAEEGAEEEEEEEGGEGEDEEEEEEEEEEEGQPEN